MIAVIIFFGSLLLWQVSGLMALMFMDSSSFWSGLFLCIYYIAMGSVVVSLLWALWIATGLTISVS